MLLSGSSMMRSTPLVGMPPGIGAAASLPNSSPSFPQASFFGSPNAPFVGSPAGNIGAAAPHSGYDQRAAAGAPQMGLHGPPLTAPNRVSGFMGTQYPQQGVLHFRPPAQIMPHSMMGISRPPLFTRPTGASARPPV